MFEVVVLLRNGEWYRFGNLAELDWQSAQDEAHYGSFSGCVIAVGVRDMETGDLDTTEYRGSTDHDLAIYEGSI